MTCGNTYKMEPHFWNPVLLSSLTLPHYARKMCLQILELYSACRCLYYQHLVDKCAAYGRPGHSIQRRTILVGYACSNHESPSGHGYPITSAQSKHGDDHPFNTARDSAVRFKDTSPSTSTSRRTTATGPYQETAPGPALRQARLQGYEPTPPYPAAQGLHPHHPVSSAPPPEIAISGNNASVANFSKLYESDESDESLDWDKESVVSVASSATTIDGDTAGMLFSKFLNFGNLRFLWPQLIAQSSSRKQSQRKVERIIYRYWQDLQKLTANPISNESITEQQREKRKKACKFILRSRRNLARRICEAHYRVEFAESYTAEDAIKTYLEKHSDAPNGSDSEGEDEPMFHLEDVETFLFRTDPIIYMQANLTGLVQLRIPQTEASIITRVWRSTQLHFENLYESFERSGKLILPGRTRLHWTCACGKTLHDDFVELRTGALDDLNQVLQGYGKDARFDNEGYAHASDIEEMLDDGNPPPQTFPRQQRDWKQSISSAANSFIGLLGSLAPGSSSLPRYRQDRGVDVATTGACVQTGSGRVGEHNFLLLCIPFMRVASKLYQPEVCRINSDQEFLKLLRHYYQTKRGQSPWRLFRKVKSINFIKVSRTPNSSYHCMDEEEEAEANLYTIPV